jgi:uncharacterized damage-inducible protein DinB
MIGELQPIWKQFEETYAPLREWLAAIPDDRLKETPAEGVASASKIIRHICRGNLVYSHMIERSERALGDIPIEPDRQELLELIDRSERRVREAFEAVTEQNAHEPRAGDWSPLGPPVAGPLDAVWFALQIVRHSAYHLGQVSYIMQLGGFSVDYPG